ncbi:MAG: hypothetical protein JO076_06310 [Verrucomicrobia bacterium]|nr:hypothetical protein [Verrucomicrobiota bacterium]
MYRILFRSLATLSCLIGVTSVAGAEDEIPKGFKLERYQKIWERNPFTLVTPVAAQAQPSVFDKLFLVSWTTIAGKDIVFVQNSENNEVQKITKDPNQHHFQLLEIHRSQNPQAFEAVISNGSEKGIVKFRADNPQSNPVLAGPGAFNPAVSQMQIPTTEPNEGQMPAIPGQSPIPSQQYPQAATRQPPTTQNYNGFRPPRAAEIHRKRLLAPPGSEQPISTPGKVQSINPGSPQ